MEAHRRLLIPASQGTGTTKQQVPDGWPNSSRPMESSWVRTINKSLDASLAISSCMEPITFLKDSITNQSIHGHFDKEQSKDIVRSQRPSIYLCWRSAQTAASQTCLLPLSGRHTSAFLPFLHLPSSLPPFLPFLNLPSSLPPLLPFLPPFPFLSFLPPPSAHMLGKEKEGKGEKPQKVENVLKRLNLPET